MEVYIQRRYRWRPSYRINWRRFLPTLTVFIAIIALIVFSLNRGDRARQYGISSFDADHLLMYFEVEQEQGVPWYFLAAVDRAEAVGDDEVSAERSGRVALHLRGIQDPGDLKGMLKGYKDDPDFLDNVWVELNKFKTLIKIYENKIFPIAQGYNYDYKNDYGAARSYGGDRSHEGIDIMCDKGVPLLSVCDGKVEKMGWLELGGWRIGIRGEDGIYYYYAHLSGYNDELKEGSHVKKGQIIGYAGDSGYGDQGTVGQFEPHLHFGMYENGGASNSEETAVNPYPFLWAWERGAAQ